MVKGGGGLGMGKGDAGKSHATVLKPYKRVVVGEVGMRSMWVVSEGVQWRGKAGGGQRSPRGAQRHAISATLPHTPISHAQAPLPQLLMLE